MKNALVFITAKRAGRDRSEGPSGAAKALAFGALASAAVLALTAVAVSDDETRQRVETTRSALQEWVQTRQLISEEKRDWALGREILNDQIALVQSEIDTVRARLVDTENEVAEADKKRAELTAERDRLVEASSSFASAVVGLEERTKALLPRLPRPIRDHVEPLSQFLPEDSASSERPLGDRYKNVVGILNEVNKFNREVHTATEVLDLGDEQSALFDVLYIGVSQGYYVDAKGEAAGIGRPGATAWTWTPANEHTQAIALAIAIRRGEKMAEFVPLPITID